MMFRDRADAGRALAKRLERFADGADIVVVGLPRGGVPVAFEVAKALGTALDICMVAKLGVPEIPELAFGAVASGGVRVINQKIVSARGMTAEEIEKIAAIEAKGLDRRATAYRGGRPAAVLEGKTVILVDDGLATGASMAAAVGAVRKSRAHKIIVAAPVADPRLADAMAEEVDEVICAATPSPLVSVGSWYEDFRQVTDDEVRSLLERSSL